MDEDTESSIKWLIALLIATLIVTWVLLGINKQPATSKTTITSIQSVSKASDFLGTSYTITTNDNKKIDVDESSLTTQFTHNPKLKGKIKVIETKGNFFDNDVAVTQYKYSK